MNQSLLYLDRYRNEGTRTYSEHAAYSEAREKYRPNAKQSHFGLAVFEVPRDEMLCYSSNPPPDLQDRYTTGNRIPFCIHPQVLNERKDDPYVMRTLFIGTRKKSVVVSASSSTRTLYVHDPEFSPHALKVHFPFRISRYGRRMRDEVIEQAVNVSRELEEGISALGDKFAIFREVIGVAHRNLYPALPRGENWGYLVRDMIPFPRVDETRDLIPGFALYGSDFFDRSRQPLLFDLIGDSDPREFVLENLMLPVLRHWIGCFRHFGFLLEPHGQNVLLEMGGDGEIRRLVHRDLSWVIDMRRRRDIGLSDENLNAYNRMESCEFHSITYDKFMGSHFFDRIVSLCQEKYPNLPKAAFTEPCRAEFTRLLPEYEAYFPETVFYFTEQRDQFDKPLFGDTGQAPEWRP